MSYFENLTPTHALETLGLRRDEVRVTDVLMPMLVAFGLGLGVGAGAALLFAPQTGRALRGELKASAGRLEQSVRKALPNGMHMDDDEMDNGEPELDHDENVTGRSSIS